MRNILLTMRNISIFLIISNLLCIWCNNHHHGVHRNFHEQVDFELIPSWMVHIPDNYLNHTTSKLGKLIDVKDNPDEIKAQVEFTDRNLAPVDGFTDGELVDALEHFFWGKKHGLSLELGALDGSPNTRSMTYAYQESLGWDRILVEANPTYRNDMIKNSPGALSINAAICSTPGKVHFAHSDYVGGIVEFMSMGFLSQYHSQIFKAGTPPGNISSIDWPQLTNVKEIECIPLSKVFHYFRINHVNFFILDVEVTTHSFIHSY